VHVYMCACMRVYVCIVHNWSGMFFDIYVYARVRVCVYMAQRVFYSRIHVTIFHSQRVRSFPSTILDCVRLCVTMRHVLFALRIHTQNSWSHVYVMPFT
jgi:KaiC/GvpD/RAD55 family RecA-like ATPase